MVELRRGLEPGVIEGNLARVREEIREAGRDPAGVEILVAVKYVPVEELAVLAKAGVTLVGENRAQDLVQKSDAMGDAFTWDFIGQLQSRKVRQILGRVRLIHSVATESALEQLGRWAPREQQILIEVNVAGEAGKAGIAPSELPRFLERCPVSAVGLMTMPPLAGASEDSRPYFSELRELAAEHGLGVLSMGTSQDYRVAVSEGATIIRLGTTLLQNAG